MDNIITYFTGEKLQCLIGAIASAITIAVSIYFLFQHKPLFKGIAYVAIPLSLLLLSVCIGLIIRTPEDTRRVTTFYTETPARIQAEEIPRMEKVMKSFTVIKNVEIALVLIGIVLALLFWRNETIRGIGIGLVVMGVALYAFDHIAESRGETYIQFLKSV